MQVDLMSIYRSAEFNSTTHKGWCCCELSNLEQHCCASTLASSPALNVRVASPLALYPLFCVQHCNVYIANAIQLAKGLELNFISKLASLRLPLQTCLRISEHTVFPRIKAALD